jgi:hypothetical protein
MVLPIDPQAHFGDIFKGWVDYLSILPEYFYDIDTFRNKCSMYAEEHQLKSSNIFVDYDSIYTQIQQLDTMLPCKNVLLDFYKIDSYEKLFESLFVKKTKRNIF